MYSTSKFKRGIKIIFQNEPYQIIDFQHHKPGKGAAVVRTKMKHLINGFIINQTFRSGNKFNKPDLSEKCLKSKLI